MAQNALTSLLQVTGKSVLIGEGTGATMAWLAADAAPNLVAGVVAIEPPGPPFCKSGPGGPKNQHDTFTEYDPKRLRYGLAGIPLMYDPPVRAPQKICEDDSDAPCLDLALYQNAGNGKKMILQFNKEKSPRGFIFLDHVTKVDATNSCVRKLTNLQKMPHVLFTAEASSHSAFDISTLHFMKQAGLEVDCGVLTEYSTFGNGHLMFLETNSDDIAALVIRWINKRVPKKGDMDIALPMSAKPVASTPASSSLDLKAQTNPSLQRTVNTTCPPVSQIIDLTAESEPNPPTGCRGSEPMELCQSEDTPVKTASTTLPPIAQPLPMPHMDFHFATLTMPENPEAFRLSDFLTLPDDDALPEDSEAFKLPDFVTLPEDDALPEKPEAFTLSDYVTPPDDLTLPEASVQYDVYHTPSPSLATEFFTPPPFPPSAVIQEPQKRAPTFERTPWRLEQQRRKEIRRPRRGNARRHDSTYSGQNHPRSGYFPPTQQWQPPPPQVPMMNQGNYHFGPGNNYLWPPLNGQQPSYPDNKTPRRTQDIPPYRNPAIKKEPEGKGSNFQMPPSSGNSQPDCFLMPPSLNPWYQQAGPFRAPGYPPPQSRG